MDPVKWLQYLKKLYYSDQPVYMEQYPLPQATGQPYFTAEKIKAAIKKMAKGKAADEYGLKIELLKMLQQEPLAQLLAEIFNGYVAEGAFPKPWNRGYIAPIFKSCCWKITEH